MNEMVKLLIDFRQEHEKNHVMHLELSDNTIFGYVDENQLFEKLLTTFESFNPEFRVRVLEKEIPENLRYATVITPTCDMRRFPIFESERIHQLIFNEKVKVLQIQTDYYLVKDLKSSYIGYVRAPQLRFSDEVKNDYNCIISSRFATITFEDFEMQLPFATKLKLIDSIDGFCYAETPRGIGKVRKESVMLISELAGKDIVEILNQYISTPYLWGGTSTFGTDCSGLVYRVYDAFEINVPRDSSQQFEKLEPVSQEDLNVGDLVLFKGHVGIYVGTGKMVHSSASLGGVYESNIFEPKDTYEEKLKRGIIGFRKVRKY